MYSLIRTAMEYGLDLYEYLSHTLRMTARVDLTKPENVAALLPENAPLECRISAPKKERDEYDVGSEKHDRRRIQYSGYPLRSAGRHVCKSRGNRECAAQQ